jgi:2-methylcitrate synthase
MSEADNSTPATGAFKPKKSVALSGVTAGNTALCTVGKTGNDLHYRGYDILDLAGACEFEEIAHLLVHEKLPTQAELAAYKTKLKALRGLPANVKAALECVPASAHPMDVMRTGVSVLGTVLPEKDDHNLPGARDIADKLMASLGSMLLYWYHYSHNGKRIEVETDDDSIGGHFLHLLHGVTPSKSWVDAMHVSLNLYAEHEFNASTFTGRVIAGTGSDFYSAITGAIGALRGPKHGGANEVAFEIQSRYQSPDEQGSRDRFRPSGVHDLGPAQQGHQGSREEPVERSGKHEALQHRRAARSRDGRREENVPESRLVQRRVVSHDGCADGDVHAAVRDLANRRLGRAHHRAARRQQDHPTQRELHGPGQSSVCAARET